MRVRRELEALRVLVHVLHDHVVQRRRTKRPVPARGHIGEVERGVLRECVVLDDIVVVVEIAHAEPVFGAGRVVQLGLSELGACTVVVDAVELRGERIGRCF